MVDAEGLLIHSNNSVTGCTSIIAHAEKELHLNIEKIQGYAF